MDIKAIREREEKATPGPWAYFPRTVGTWIKGVGFEDQRSFIPSICYVYDKYKTNTEQDGEFIAHSREDIPALCDEVERLRAELSAIKLGAVNAMVGRLVGEEKKDG